MSDKATPTPVKATLTIEGDAWEILAEARRLKTKGVVLVEMFIPEGRYGARQWYSLPAISGGQTNIPLQTLRTLVHQTKVPLTDEQRVGDLIQQFGMVT